MGKVNRRRRTVLQVQVGELYLWRLSQSSSPRKCRFHLGFSLVNEATDRLADMIHQISGTSEADIFPDGKPWE